MIQLHITKTSKSYNPKDKYSIYDTENKFFNSMDEAKEWINTEYPNNKKAAMFNDNIEGQTGYIIGFRNSEYFEGKQNNFLEQHWIQFRENNVIAIKQTQSKKRDSN